MLLNRAYSESSWIVEVFSKNHGRLALMAKGARRVKSKHKGVLLPFQPLLLSWTGKGEIPILTGAEIDQREFSLLDHELCGDALVCGFYCNELIVNLLHRHDPHKDLFTCYQHTILALGCISNKQAAEARAQSSEVFGQLLRDFEQTLIKEAGYGISFAFEADGKTAISDHQYYRFQQGQGFIASGSDKHRAVSGRLIKSLAATAAGNSGEPVSAAELTEAKHLMRSILNQTLGYKKVVSRELFFPRERLHRP